MSWWQAIVELWYAPQVRVEMDEQFLKRHRAEEAAFRELVDRWPMARLYMGNYS
jgi:hypothetical protein